MPENPVIIPRQSANVAVRYALFPVPKTFFFTFIRDGDRWLIDGALGEISFSVP